MTATDDELAIRNLIARFAEATDVGTLGRHVETVTRSGGDWRLVRRETQTG